LAVLTFVLLFSLLVYCPQLRNFNF